MIPIVKLPHCPSFWRISNIELVNEIALNGYLRPCLQIKWKTSRIIGLDGQSFHLLPKKMHVSICKGICLRKILATRFYVTPYFLHDNVVFQVTSKVDDSSMLPVNEATRLTTSGDEETPV